MLSLIISQAWRHAKDYFKKRTVAKTVTMLGFFAVFGLVMTAMYFGMSMGLRYIQHDSAAEAVSLYTYELVLLVIVALSIATAIIEGSYLFFKNKRNLWILATPGYRSVPNMLLISTILGGAFLPTIILALPTLFAMQHVYSIGLGGFILGLLAILLVVALVIVFTVTLVFAIAKLIEYFSKYTTLKLTITKVLTTAFALFMLFLCLAWRQASVGDVRKLFPEFQPGYPVTQQNSGLQTISHRFSLFPSHQAAAVLVDIQKGAFVRTIVPMLILIVLCGIGYVLFKKVTQWYLPLWQSLQEEPVNHPRGMIAGPQVFPRHSNTALGALFEKEWLMIIRNGKDVAWMVFMIVLWLVQIGTDILVKRNALNVGLSSFPVAIQSFEVGVIAFFLGAFILRFAFPSLSTERGTAWVLVASPLPLKKIFLNKLRFFTVLFSAIGVGVALVHGISISLPVSVIAYISCMALLMACTITVLGMSMGAVFPNFESDDAQQLSTSLPGLTFVAMVLIYGVIASRVFGMVLTSYKINMLVYFILLSVVIIGISLWRALVSLKTVEFGVVTE